MAEVIKINQLCEVTSSKRIFAKEYVEEGVPFFRGKEITEKYNGKLDVSTELYITNERYDEIKKKHGVPLAGDLLLTSVGTLGSIYVVQADDKFYFKDGNITWFRGFSPLLDSTYLRYWLESDDGRAELKKSIIGSSQSAYTISNLGQMEIILPSLELQKKVVGILSAYDELLKNNTNRIAILENMAQNLYREWFVNFRFPGHEQSQWQDTPQGKIPASWRTTSFECLVDLIRESVSKGNLEVGVPHIGLEHLPRKSIALSDWEVVSEIGSSKLKFNKYDILFGKIRPYFHKVGVAQIPGICSADAFVWRVTRPEYFGLAICIASSDDFVLHSNQTSQGTKMPRANWDVLKNYTVVLPSEGLMVEFNKFIKNIVDQIIILSTKNRNLKQQRDMVLLKLLAID